MGFEFWVYSHQPALKLKCLAEEKTCFVSLAIHIVEKCIEPKNLRENTVEQMLKYKTTAKPPSLKYLQPTKKTLKRCV